MGEPHRKGDRKPDSQHGAHRQPITRHPLFPAIVALWGAALFGLAGLVLAPTLGMTAPLLGLALGVLGGMTGWVAARRMAGPRPMVRRPVLNPAEDLRSELPWPAVKAYPDQGADEVPSDDAADIGFSRYDAPLTGYSDAAVEPPLAAAGPVAADASPHPEAPAPQTAAERIAVAQLAELSHVELVERLAIAIQRRQDGRAGDGELPQPVVRFPGLADRQGARLPLPADPANAAGTEQALRQALAQLQRMSGSA